MFTPFAFVKEEAAAGGGNGPLTAAFIAAAGITGSANIQGLNDFETGLTTYGLTSKMTCVYPLMGGNSTSTSYNFMNTSLYRITWSGNFTYYINGAQSYGYGNGTGATGILGNQLSVAEGHHCVQIVTDESPGTWNGVNYPSEYGCNGDPYNSSLSQYYGSIWAANGLTVAYPCNNATGQGNGSLINGAQATALGLYVISRTSASNLFMTRNNSVTLTNTTTLSNRSYSSGLDPLNLFTRGTAYSSRRQAFVTIGVGTGTGLSTTEASDLYTLITAFNTTIGR